MDTIIDTRQFPKEMEEKAPQPPKQKKEKSSFPFFWIIFFLILLFGGYYLYTNYSTKEDTSIVQDVEKQNEFIQKVVEKKDKIPAVRYEKEMSHLFGE